MSKHCLGGLDMESLIGRTVSVHLVEENPPLRLEGRVDDERDGLVEVRLRRIDPPALAPVFRRTLHVELECVDQANVWGTLCVVESYGLVFPPVLWLRAAGKRRLVQRRRHQRHPTDLPACLVYLDDPQERRQEGRLIDLSLGGAALVVTPEAAPADPWPMAPGGEAFLQFVAGEVVRPRSRVVRCAAGAERILYGLEFLAVSPHDATVLHAYLEHLDAREAAAARG